MRFTLLILILLLISAGKPAEQRPARQGLAAARSGGFWGFVDGQGGWAIPARWDAVGDFSEGLAWVRRGDEIYAKFGYIDRRGQTIIPPQYQYGRSFAGGLAAVRDGEKWGYIDKQGTWVIPPRYDYAESHKQGKAVVRIHDKKQIIDLKGQPVP